MIHIRCDLLKIAVGCFLWQMPQFKAEFTSVRHDVERPPALNGSDVQRTVGHAIAIIDQTVLMHRFIDITDVANQIRCNLYRVDAFDGIG